MADRDKLFQQYILRFEITMDQMSLVQQTQRIQELLGKHAYEGRTQASELILFDQFIKVDTKKLKCQTQVLPVDECIF